MDYAQAQLSPNEAGLDAVAGQLIYHYTDLKGLIGIIQHRRLWATDVRYLNDTSESTYGDARLSALLEEDVMARPVLPDLQESFLGNWRDFPKAKRLFVACFCADDDLLSQWRGYGRLGYSIGFDRKALEEIGRQSQPGYILRDMLYSEAEQRAQIKKTVDDFFPLFSLSMNETATAILPSGASYLAVGLWGLIAGTDFYELVTRLKHEAFEEEREVRAIYRVESGEAQGVELRESALGPTPYAQLDISESPESTALREIRIGPTPHEDEAREGVVELLKHPGLPDVTVRNSKIPFRW